MNEIKSISELFQTLGISSLFAPLLATISIFYLLRRYVLSGAGDFLKSVTSQYLKQNNERIILETKIDIKLGSLTESLERFVAQLMDIEKRNSERITQVKTELSERITTIEVVLSDKVFDELSQIKNSLKDHFEEFDDNIERGHNCTQKVAMMNTEEFRAKREQARKEIIK